MSTPIRDAESRRLHADALREQNWKRWGPYLSERQWGTVREDYSADGSAWTYFPHDHARSRAYRWGEDGLLGFTDRECRMCFAVALWNGRDPILKERLFGLTGPEGNHGEDVKECYYYLDSTPTHSYCKALYKYPQAEFPYARLVAENARRSRSEREFELADTSVFDGGYWDVLVEYAKDAPDDAWIRLTLANRGPRDATVHVLPTVWFRNTWSWGCTHEGCGHRPSLQRDTDGVLCDHATLGRFRWLVGPGPDGNPPPLLFTENETNATRLFGTPARPGFFKDAFHDYVIAGKRDTVNPKQTGTKAAAHYTLSVPAGGQVVLHARLCAEADTSRSAFPADAERVFRERIAEADAFHALLSPPLPPEQDRVLRQARAGLLWSKQFYHYVVRDWLHGDPEPPPPPDERRRGRNHDWGHIFARDVLSMPDKWEYPWFAAWDLAFHMVPFARIDPHFARHQLVLLLREWYMHPSGQVPAYEFNFSDVNPPVHAWACWKVYQLGGRDRLFLARTFQKLLLNFTWWVNRKDVAGKHLFAGGFLGLDNIGVFDRSRPLPSGTHLEQADGTAWVAFYCATMLKMALELAREDAAYEDLASKFLEHFVAIADAMNALGGVGLWDEQDGFYYDQLHVDGRGMPLRIRSIVGLIPLIAAGVLEESLIQRLPGFRKRLHWFLENRPDLAHHLAFREVHCLHGEADHTHEHRLLAIPTRERLERILRYMLDENEFLSPFGIRSLSRFHRDHPYSLWVDGAEQRVAYVPGESDVPLFGGNSNWRGPVWFPVNYLLIESLHRYHHFYGDDLRVECPTGSGRLMNLDEVAGELTRRLCSLFLPDASGRRPALAGDERYASDPHWKDLVLFHEYFQGDSGEGLGAAHQTGWTALVASLLTDDVGAAMSEARSTGEHDHAAPEPAIHGPAGR